MKTIQQILEFIKEKKLEEMKEQKKIWSQNDYALWFIFWVVDMCSELEDFINK